MQDPAVRGAREILHQLHSPANEPSVAGGEEDTAADVGLVILATPYQTEDT